MKRSCWIAVVLLAALHLPVKCLAEGAWAIQGIRLTPWSEEARVFSAMVSDPKKGRPPFEIRGTVPLTEVRHYFIAANKLVLTGKAGNASAVVLFDLLKRKKLDWFYCYGPQRISRDWLAYVEFYPNHAPGQWTDVVLLYDLSKSPYENRINGNRNEVIPAADRDSPVRVGIPAYPKVNAQQRSYDNNVLDATAVRRVLGSDFVLLPRRRLVFVATEGGEFRTLTDYIVVVDLAAGIHDPSITTVPIPKNNLRTTENPAYVKVDRISVQGSNTVVLHVSAQEYGTATIDVDIP